MINPHDSDFSIPGIIEWQPIAPGLTKREYFAAMAIAGWSANSKREGTSQDYALAAVAMADALIAALNKKK